MMASAEVITGNLASQIVSASSSLGSAFEEKSVPSASTLELRTSLMEFEAWLCEQETRMSNIQKELTQNSDLKSLPDLKCLPLDKLVVLTDPQRLSSKALFAKCITPEGKSIYDSNFDYNQPIGTIIREKEFDTSNKKCGKGIHLVLPCDAIRLAIMYHYLGHQDVKICFVTVPQLDPLDRTINKVVKSNAYDHVQKLRVAFVQVEGFAVVEGFAKPQIPCVELVRHIPVMEIPKPKETLTSVQKMDINQINKTWQNLQILYTRMCMTLNCKNLPSDYYAHLFVEMRKYLESKLELNVWSALERKAVKWMTKKIERRKRKQSLDTET